MKTKVFTTFFLLAFSLVALAQKGVDDGSKYGHGEDSIRCVSNLSLFIEYAKQKNYNDALKPWTIAYGECPSSSLYIYTYGEDIIVWQLENASTDDEKEQYIAELLNLYDQRIKYFGDHNRYPEPYILGKKAVIFQKYKGNTTDGQVKAMEMYKSAIDGLLKKLNRYTIGTLLSSIQNYMGINFNLYNRNEITSENLITNYEEMQEVLDNVLKATSNSPKYKDNIVSMKESFENYFANSGAADCETLEAMYTPKIEEGKNDKELLTKTLELFEKTGCTESELFYATSEYLHAIEPSSSSAFGIARMYLNPQKLDIDKALEYYNQALELEKDDERKADYLYQMALIIFSKKENYPEARSLARRAIRLKSNWGAPYILIGQMYAAAAQKQQLGEKDIENQAGYWAAVDKFAQAKKVDPEIADEADQQIRIFSNYFPNKEEIFFQEGFELNQPYTVGGWINEKTICRPKD